MCDVCSDYRIREAQATSQRGLWPLVAKERSTGRHDTRLMRLSLQDGSDAVRAAQAAAAKALSGSHGSGGSLARTGSGSSLSGRQARPRDREGPAAPPPAFVTAARAQSDVPRVATEVSAANDRRVTAAGFAPRPEAAHVASVGQPSQAGDWAPGAQPAQASDWAAEAQPEMQPSAAASSEEPEAPVTPALGAEKVRTSRAFNPGRKNLC